MSKEAKYIEVFIGEEEFSIPTHTINAMVPNGDGRTVVYASGFIKTICPLSIEEIKLKHYGK